MGSCKLHSYCARGGIFYSIVSVDQTESARITPPQPPTPTKYTHKPHKQAVYRILEFCWYMDRIKRIWYLSPMRAAKVQASLRIRSVSPEPSLLAHTSSESRGTFREKARSLAPLNGWACAVKICHDGMLEDTNSLDGAHIDIHPRENSCDVRHISKRNVPYSRCTPTSRFCRVVSCTTLQN